MRTLTYLLAISVVLLVSIAQAQNPAFVVVSTEVDETIDGTGYMQRHALSLEWPDYYWYSSGAIFFDPADVIDDPNFPNGIDTGLDAFHYNPLDLPDRDIGQFFFATEVDFGHGAQHFEDEDLVMYDEFTGSLTEVFDVKDVLGDDYGLDAATFLGFWYDDDPAPTIAESGYWAFSTEVDGIGFTDDDILITDGNTLVAVIPMTFIFGQEVGLDALHYLGEGYEGSWADTSWAISTEVDGVLPNIAGAVGEFRDEDILVISFDGNQVGDIELVWTGIEGFDRDVGLDALYISPTNIPEPGMTMLMGTCLGLFVLRLRKRG